MKENCAEAYNKLNLLSIPDIDVYLYFQKAVPS